MRKYLAELHKKPDHHKKQFALLASGTITLFIFGVWSLATFGINEGIVAKDEAGPFQSFRSNVASSLEAIKSNFGQLKDGFKTMDFKTEYQEMKNGALNIYGQ